MSVYSPEIYTPMTFDLEILMLSHSLKEYFGEKVLEKDDIKDLFRDFYANPMNFVQLWDTINYKVMEESLEIDN